MLRRLRLGLHPHRPRRGGCQCPLHSLGETGQVGELFRGGRPAFEATQTLVIPAARDEEGYVLVQGNIFNGNSNEVTLLAELAELSLERMSANSAGNGGTGRLSASIHGAGFDASTIFRLAPVAGGPPDRGERRYDCRLPPRRGGLRPRGRTGGLLRSRGAGRKRTGSSTDSRPSSRSSRRRSHRPSRRALRGIETYRYNRVARITLRYRNIGGAEITAPLFLVVAPEDTLLRLGRDDMFPAGEWASELQLLGIHPGGVPGKLPPGAEVEIPIDYQSEHCFSCSAEFQLYLFTPRSGDFVGWDTLEVPAEMTRADWEAAWPELSVSLGARWKEYHEALASLATRLTHRGVYGASVRELFRFAVREALGRPSDALLGRLTSEGGVPIAHRYILARQGGVVRSNTLTDRDGAFAIDWLKTGGPTISPSRTTASPGRPREREPL